MLKEEPDLDPNFTNLPSYHTNIPSLQHQQPRRAINSLQSVSDQGINILTRYSKVYTSDEQRIYEIINQEVDNFDLTLPNHNYEGPGTKFVTNIYNNVKPVNNTDKLAMKHDLQYTIDPTQLGQIKADLDAIFSGLKTPLSSKLDFLSRVALELGLITKTLVTPSPVYQLYKLFDSVASPSEKDKMLIMQLYNQTSSHY